MEYYISSSDGKRGPYSVSELEARGLTAETLVMAENSSEWTPAWQVDELRDAVGMGGQQVDPVGKDGYEENAGQDILLDDSDTGQQPETGNDNPEDGPTADSENFQQGVPVPPSNEEDEPKGHSGCLKAFLIGFAALLVLAAVAVVTCPKEADHKAALTNVVAETVSEEINGTDSTLQSDDIAEKFFRDISDAFSRKVVSAAVNNLIYVDNNFVCSVGKVRIGGKERTVSVGLFGHVFTVDKEDLRKAARKYYSKAEKEVTGSLEDEIGKAVEKEILDPLGEALEEAFKDEPGNVEQDKHGRPEYHDEPNEPDEPDEPDYYDDYDEDYTDEENI